MKQIKVELQAIYGGDSEIANAAWTSSTEYQSRKKRTKKDVKRIIDMLADLKHSVPFESVILRFWIRLPITADRQIMSHRLQSASGMSGRYRTMPHDYQEFPEDVEEITSKFNAFWDNEISTTYNFMQEYYSHCESANNSYRMALKAAKLAETQGKINNKEYKRVREFMRGQLPQNNMTERVTIMNLRAFANFIKLRNSEHAQPEIRYIAQEMLKAVKKSKACKFALEALERNGWSV